MRFITRHWGERPRLLEWVQYPMHNVICNFRSLENRMGGWMLLCLSLREYIREDIRGCAYFRPGPLHVSGSFLGASVVAPESFQSNFPRTLLDGAAVRLVWGVTCVPNSWQLLNDFVLGAYMCKTQTHPLHWADSKFCAEILCCVTTVYQTFCLLCHLWT